jgi:ABC-2 type transport system permease protein
MAETRAAGAIYDLGYQRYQGTRLGRANAFKSLLIFSLRTAFGLGRGVRSKIIPFIVLAIVFFPAVATVFAASATGMATLINYAGQLQFTGYLLALFAAAQAPELIVTDRQHGVLSLYLSRPLSGPDYAIAKLGALVGAMLVLTLGPQLFLFIGKIGISTTPWVAFKAEYGKLVPIVGGMLVISCFMAAIGLSLASLASRRAYASAAVIGFFLLTPAISSLTREASTGDVKRYSILLNPLLVITGFSNWLFDIEAKRRSTVGRADLPGTAYLYVVLGVCIVGISILWWRYRRSEA